MTAPVLVMVARSSQDARVARVAHLLADNLTMVRGAVCPRVAFIDRGEPSITELLDELQATGQHEVVLVPLDVTSAIEVGSEVTQAYEQAKEQFPNLALTLSRPLGPEASLLTVLDVRLRTALAQARVLELDGLVLSSASTGDVRGTALLARRARQWSTHHRLPCLTAVADGTGPSVAQAIQGLRAQGRRHIAVGSFFLGPDERYVSQVELAMRAGAVAVSEPIGAASEVTDLVLARYAFAAMDLLDFDEAGAYVGPAVDCTALSA